MGRSKGGGLEGSGGRPFLGGVDKIMGLAVGWGARKHERLRLPGGT